MRIVGYGEDALTLWALQNKLDLILNTLDDPSPLEDCELFYRPSFGRSGGSRSPQFGEFDFIILANTCLYLGESKWARSPSKADQDTLKLPERQICRHQLFAFYVKQWILGDHVGWEEFRNKASIELQKRDIEKPIAPSGSLLAANLQIVLDKLRERYASPPVINNVLLFLHKGLRQEMLPQRTNSDFTIVPLDYSEALILSERGETNFIQLGATEGGR